MGLSKSQLRKMGIEPDDLESNPRGAGGSKKARPEPDLSEVTDDALSFDFVIPERAVPTFHKDQPNSYGYKPPETRKFQDFVKLKAKKARPEHWPMTLKYQIVIRPYYPDGRHADITNVVKVVEDALTGVAWRDDRLVFSQRNDKYIRPDRECIEIEISILTDRKGHDDF